MFLVTVLFTLFILLAIYGYMVSWLKSKLKPVETDGGTLLSVSVVIPFRNEENTLPDLLQSLRGQNYQGDLEVILVNDHSTDRSVDVVKGFIDQNTKPDFRLINVPEGIKGKKNAIVTGLTYAKGELIVQTDADCVMNEKWLETLVSGFDEATELIFGPVAMRGEGGFWSRFAALEFLSLQASGAGFALGKKPIMGSAANMAYRKSSLDKLNLSGSAVSSGDDVFLIQALAKQGEEKVKFILNKEAQTYTSAPATFGEFITQRARWGSKTTSYTSRLAIAVAALIAGLSMLLCGLVALSFWQFAFLEVFALVTIMKGVEDYFFLRKYALQTQQAGLLKVFIPTMLIYPFYICITGVAMLFKTSWKGRFIQK